MPPLSRAEEREISRAIPHTGRGRRVGILVGSIVVVVGVLWFVARGFHGRQIKRGAAAMTERITEPVTAPAR